MIVSALLLCCLPTTEAAKDKQNVIDVNPIRIHQFTCNGRASGSICDTGFSVDVHQTWWLRYGGKVIAKLLNDKRTKFIAKRGQVYVAACVYLVFKFIHVYPRW